MSLASNACLQRSQFDGPGSVMHGMQITARAAHDQFGGGQFAGRAFLHGHHHARDLITGALVIDQRAGAKFGDGEETRAGDKFLGLLRGAPAGDVGGQRKAREIVAGQKPSLAK